MLDALCERDPGNLKSGPSGTRPSRGKARKYLRLAPPALTSSIQPSLLKLSSLRPLEAESIGQPSARGQPEVSGQGQQSRCAGDGDCLPRSVADTTGST